LSGVGLAVWMLYNNNCLEAAPTSTSNTDEDASRLPGCSSSFRDTSTRPVPLVSLNPRELWLGIYCCNLF